MLYLIQKKFAYLNNLLSFIEYIILISSLKKYLRIILNNKSNRKKQIVVNKFKVLKSIWALVGFSNLI